MKNRATPSNELARELTEPVQPGAQLEELQIEGVRELSRHHSAIFGATTDFVGMASADGRLLYINPAGLEMCGLEKGTDVTKCKVQDFHSERTNKLLREEFFPICAKEGVWSGELDFLHQDGHEILTSSVVLGHKSENGELAYVSTISRDITERKQAEKALESTTAQLTAVTDAMSSFVADGNWRRASATLLSDALRQTESGYGFIGVVVDGPILRILAHEGIVWHDTLGRDFYDEAQRAYEQVGYLEFTSFDNLFGNVITSGKTIVCNNPTGDSRSGGLPKGHPPLDHFLGVPIKSGTKVTGMIGVANRPGGYAGSEQSHIEILSQASSVLYDSYCQQEQEAALKRTLSESEEKFRLVTETIEDVFWLSTPEIDRILYISPAYAQLWGRSVDELYESPESWTEAIHPEDKDRILGTFEEFAQGRFDHEYRIVRPDGSVRWIRDRGYPTRNENGNVLFMVGVARDITKRKRAEEALQQARDQLEDRVKERTRELSTAYEELRQRREELAHVSRVATMAELSSSLAHELNQPLTAILTNAQTLGRLQTGGKVDDEEFKEIVQDIVEDARRAGQIIRHQRDFLRRGDLEKRPLDLNEVIRGVQELARPDVRLVLDLVSDLPEVVGDRIQLEQVLLNLIRNGSDAMKNVAEDLRELVVKTSTSASEITVAVHDTGPPLEDEVFDQLFEPFYTTKPQGLGMGLSISRSIIEAPCGHLWATRHDKKGMTLSFTLPVSQGDPDE